MNQAVLTNTNQTNLPEGLSANQIAPTGGTTPGIPDPKSINSNNNANGTSSTPGIPDTTKTGKTPATSKTPRIPGIPDEETLKKQMNTPVDKSIMDRKPPQMESNSTARPNPQSRNARNSNLN